MLSRKHSLLRRLAPLIVFLSLAIAAPAPAQARPASLPFKCLDVPGFQVMVHVDGAFARALNGWKEAPVGRLLKFQCYQAIGRDFSAEWAYIAFGNAHVWVNRNDVRTKDGTDLTQLPVLMSTAELIAPTPVARTAAGVPTVSQAIKDLYAKGIAAGRDPAMVTVIGDCNSEKPVFLGRVAAGVVNLSALPDLKAVAAYVDKSFRRSSVATHGSFSSGMAFDPTWSDPKLCKAGEGPLACELRQSNASVLIVSLGTGDTFDWQSFEGNYRRIIEYALSTNVVPVLVTKADALESQQGGAPADTINAIVRALGARYGVPVIDFAAAAQSLPNGGLLDERSLDGEPIQPFHVNELGMDLRIVQTLQTLAQFVSAPKPTPTPRAARPARAPKPTAKP
jgi:hypothetical protein